MDQKNIMKTLTSDGDPLILRKQILIHISGRLDSILIFIKQFMSVFKYLKFLFSYKNVKNRSVVKTDPCLYFFKYSPDALKKKTKDLDISKMFYEN